MKAFEIHSARSASVVDRPEPVPRPGEEVRVRVRLVGMCGTDPNHLPRCQRNGIVSARPRS